MCKCVYAYMHLCILHDLMTFKFLSSAYHLPLTPPYCQLLEQTFLIPDQANLKMFRQQGIVDGIFFFKI